MTIFFLSIFLLLILAKTTDYFKFIISRNSSINNSNYFNSSFPNLFKSLNEISQNSSFKDNSTIIIFLSNSQNHFILEKHLTISPISLNRKKNIKLTIKPIYCEEFNIFSNSSCIKKSKNEQILIKIKTRNFNFFVEKYLHLESIFLDFIDTIFYYNLATRLTNFNRNDPNICYNLETSPCCEENNLFSNCSIDNIIFTNSFFYGFINLEKNSVLEIINIGISNLYCGITSVFGWNSLVLVIAGNAEVLFENFLLRNSVVTQGIVSFPYGKAQAFLHNDVQMSLGNGNILLKNITIMNYNPKGFINVYLFDFEKYSGKLLFKNLTIIGIKNTEILLVEELPAGSFAEDCYFNLIDQSKITLNSAQFLFKNAVFLNSSLYFQIANSQFFLNNSKLMNISNTTNLFNLKNSKIFIEKNMFLNLNLHARFAEHIQGEFYFTNNNVSFSKMANFLFGEKLIKINIVDCEFREYSDIGKSSYPQFFFVKTSTEMEINKTKFFNVKINVLIEIEDLNFIKIFTLQFCNSYISNHFFFNKKQNFKSCIFSDFLIQNSTIGRFTDISTSTYNPLNTLILQDITYSQITVTSSNFFSIYRMNTLFLRNTFKNITLTSGRFLFDLEQYAPFTIKDSIFYNIGWENLPNKLAIYDQSIVFTFQVENITIENTIFLEKQSIGRKLHWWIFCYKTSGFTTINNITAKKFKSVLSSSGKYVGILNSFFEEIRCPGIGNAIYVVSGSLLVLGLEKTGDIWVEVMNTRFRNNSCRDGGALAIIDVLDVSMNNCSFEESVAEFGGHIYLKDLSKLTLTNTILANSSAIEGGALFALQLNSLTISSLSLNNSFNTHGSIYLELIPSATISSLNTFHTHSSLTAGVIFLKLTNLIINHSKLSYTKASLFGGAVFATLNSNFTAENITITSAEANYGGFFYITGGLQVALFDSFVNNPFAKISGSAVFIDFAEGLTISNLTINNAKTSSGTIFIKSFSENHKNLYTLSDLNFKGCEAVLGACVFFESSSESLISGLSAENCSGNLFTFSWNTKINVTLKDFVVRRVKSYKKELILIENSQILIENFTITDSALDYLLFLLKNSIISIRNIFIQPKYSENINIFFLKDSVFNLKTGFLTLITSFSHNLFFLQSEKTQIFINNLQFNCNFLQSKALFSIENNFADLQNIKLFYLQGKVFLLKNTTILLQNSFFSNLTGNSFGFLITAINKNFIKNSQNITNVKLHNSTGIAFYSAFIENIYCKNITYFAQNYQKVKIFSLENIKNFTILDSFFEKIESEEGSFLTISSQNNLLNIYFDNNIFKFVKTLLGSVFQVDGYFNLFIKQSIFENCLAVKGKSQLGIGAVGFLHCDKNCKILVKQSVFRNNYAENYAPTIFKKNYFYNNSDSSYLHNNFLVASPTISFRKITLPNSNYSISNNSFISGQKYFISLGIQDSNNYSWHFASGIRLEVNSLNEFVKVSNNLAFSEKGIFTFPEISFFGPSDFKFSLKFSGQFMMPNSKKITFGKTKNFMFLPCTFGSILKLDKSCLECSFGTYSFSEPNTTPFHLQKCHSCPEGALCLGKNLIFPLAGYWIPLKNSSFITNCLIADACKGSEDFYENNKNINYKEIFSNLDNEKRNFCEEGHYGILCYNCLDGYGKSSGNKCSNCKSANNGFALFRIILLVVIVFFSFCKFIYENFFTEPNILEGNLEGYIKVLINHLQVSDIILSGLLFFLLKFRDKVVDTLSEISDIFDLISFDFMYNQCFLPKISLISENYTFAKLLFLYVSPFFFSFLSVFVIMMVLLILIAFKNRKKKKKINKKQLKSMMNLSKKNLGFFILIFIYLFYPTIIKNTFKIFNCFELSPEISDKYLTVDPNIICFSTKHFTLIFVLCLPGLVIFAVFYPVHLYRSLRPVYKKIKSDRKSLIQQISIKDNNNNNDNNINNMIVSQINKLPIKKKSSLLGINLKNLHNTGFTNSFIFFSNGYKQKYYYWECCLFIKKLFIAFFISANFFQQQIRNALFVVVLLVETYLTFTKKPYATNVLNFSVLFSNFVLTFSLLSIEITQKENSKDIKLAFLILMALLNVMYLVFMMFFIIKYGLINAKKIVQEVNEKRKKLSSFLKSSRLSLNKSKKKNNDKNSIFNIIENELNKDNNVKKDENDPEIKNKFKEDEIYEAKSKIKNPWGLKNN